MIALLRKIGLCLGKVALAPFVALGSGTFAGGSLIWLLHGILVAAICGGLWFANAWLGLDSSVHAPSRWLREMWLPLVFLLTYGVAWVGLWTWRAFTMPQAASPFPEIDTAWQQAIAALGRHGTNLTEKPLILLLGEPAGRETELLSALELSPTFGPLPSKAESPLRLFADESANYLLCHDASVLSACAEQVVLERLAAKPHAISAPTIATETRLPTALRAPALVGAHAGDKGSETVNHAINPASSTAEVEQPFEAAEAAVEDLVAAFENDVVPTRDQKPLVSAEDADLANDRLEHLLRLVADERGTTPPVSGVALLMPCDTAADSRTALATTEAIRHDLEVVAQVAKVRCPVVSIVTDLQHTPGCGRVLHALSADRKHRRFGKDLPLNSLTSEQVLRETVESLTNNMATTLCERLFHIGNEQSVAADMQENASLFAFQRTMAERGRHLQEMLAQGLAGEQAEAWPLVSCNLVATGDPVAGSQAFGGGILEGLVEQTPRTTWTTEALAEDARCERTVTFGYAGLAAAVVIVAGMLAL